MASEKVRAAVQTGTLAYELRELERPRIGDDDGLLRIEACGVCGSDVEQRGGGDPAALPRLRPLPYRPLHVLP
jgi:D-arabinose 1-dehydrogenase-like Zn-dependent alcohol dehydrogenase